MEAKSKLDFLKRCELSTELPHLAESLLRNGSKIHPLNVAPVEHHGRQTAFKIRFGT